MKKKNAEPIELETMSPKNREKSIDELERERFALTKKIEDLMTKYAKASGNRKLKRMQRPGHAPNDYTGEQK